MTPSYVVRTPHLQFNGLFKNNSQVQLSCVAGYYAEERASAAPLEKLYSISSHAKCVYHSGAMRWFIGTSVSSLSCHRKRCPKVATSVSCRCESMNLHYASVSFRTAWSERTCNIDIHVTDVDWATVRPSPSRHFLSLQ